VKLRTKLFVILAGLCIGAVVASALAFYQVAERSLIRTTEVSLNI